MKKANHFLVFSATLVVALASFAEAGSNAAKACAKLKAAVRVAGVDDRAMGVALDGKTLYCIAGRSLYALDVADPLSPKVIGRLDGMDNRRQVAVADGFAYVVSRETGLRIVDVRDPRKMRLCSRYDSVEFATGVDVVGKTVFLSERINGVEAADVSDPDHPRHLCIRKTGESQSNRYRNGFLYSGEWGVGRVTVFDAHDMRAFREIGTLELGGFGDGLEIDGRYLYCSTGHDARHHRAAQLLAGHRESKIDDLADPTQNSAELVGAGRGLDIFDLADPAKPRHVSRVDFPVFKPRNDDYWTVRVADGLAFCCDSHNGLFVVDVHDPTCPKVIDRFCVPEPGKDWPSGAISSVAVGEGCIYVTSFPGGLWVVPVAGVKPPVRDKGAPPANATAAEAYPTDKGKFHVYRPAAAGQARTACVRGDMVYVAFGDAGLHVLKIKPEGGFEKLGELPGGKRVTDCCFVGDRLVTAEGLDGWAVYALDGPTGFREVARRPTTPHATVAFWCWPAGTKYAVLSPRNGPYCVVGLDDFMRPDPFCKIHVTCLWDKYLPDALVGDQLAILNPYSGLVWCDFSGLVPKAGAREKRRAQPAGAQVNGICAFGDRYLYTVDDRYQFVLSDGSKTELRALPPVPEFQKTNRPRFTGIPRSDGRLVALTNRSGARYAVYDFADPQNPKLLDAGELSGRPDLAAFWNGHVIIPAGHQGLLLSVRPYVGDRHAGEPVRMKAILTLPHEFDMLVRSGHIQGLACSEKGIYLSHQTGLAKIGWDGKMVKHIEVPGHLGGIACANGRIYGAFIIRRREDMKDGKPGLLRVWDEDLNLVGEKAFQETAGAVGVLGDTIYYAIGHGKAPHRSCSVKRLGFDLADRGDQTFDFGYDIKYGIQALATDGTSLICANYGGVSLVNPAFTSFRKLKCPSFAEGLALVPKSIAKRETPVFMAVRALGGNMKGWRRDPANNPPRLRLEFYAFDGEAFTDITE